MADEFARQVGLLDRGVLWRRRSKCLEFVLQLERSCAVFLDGSASWIALCETREIAKRISFGNTREP